MSRVHCFPVNDLIEHDTDGDDCVCGPDFEFVEGGVLISHHSLDGRELHEERAESSTWRMGWWER